MHKGSNFVSTLIAIVLIVLLLVLLYVLTTTSSRTSGPKTYTTMGQTGAARLSSAACAPTLTIQPATAAAISMFDLYNVPQVTTPCSPSCTNQSNWYGCVVPFSTVLQEAITGQDFVSVFQQLNTFVTNWSVSNKEVKPLWDYIGAPLFTVQWNRLPPSYSAQQKVLALFNALQVTPGQVSELGQLISAAVAAGKMTALPIKTYGEILYQDSSKSMPNPLSSSLVQNGFYASQTNIAPLQPSQIKGSNVYSGVLPNFAYDAALNKRNYLMACAFDNMIDNIGTATPSTPPFSVLYNNVSYTSVGDYLTALSKDGHPISVAMYSRVAGFVQLLYSDCANLQPDVTKPGAWQPGTFSDVVFDLMLNTQFTDSQYGFPSVDKSTMDMLYPVLHSEVHFQVGPVPNPTPTPTRSVQEQELNFIVSFTSGDFQGGKTGFSPDPFHQRIPPWAGNRQIMSQFTTQQVLDLAYFAEAYAYVFNKITFDDNFTWGGYGTIGVCDDCVGTLQQCVLGYNTTYPQALNKARFVPGIQQVLSNLPTSAEYLRQYLEVMCQAVQAQPSDAAGPSTTGPSRLLATAPYLWNPNAYQAPLAVAFNTNQGMAKIVQNGGATSETITLPLQQIVNVGCGGSNTWSPSNFTPLNTTCVSSIVLPFNNSLNSTSS